MLTTFLEVKAISHQVCCDHEVVTFPPTQRVVEGFYIPSLNCDPTMKTKSEWTRILLSFHKLSISFMIL